MMMAGWFDTKAHGMYGMGWAWLAGVLVALLWVLVEVVCIFALKTNNHDRDWRIGTGAGERMARTAGPIYSNMDGPKTPRRTGDEAGSCDS